MVEVLAFQAPDPHTCIHLGLSSPSPIGRPERKLRMCVLLPKEEAGEDRTGGLRVAGQPPPPHRRGQLLAPGDVRQARLEDLLAAE